MMMTSRSAASTRSVPRRSGLRSKPSHRASLARLSYGRGFAWLRMTFTSQQASVLHSLPGPARPGQGRSALALGSWSPGHDGPLALGHRRPVPSPGTFFPVARGRPAARLATWNVEEIAMTGTTNGIVVGYDGSPGSAQALRWAAREAWARGTTLTVCLAWTPDHMELPTESTLCDVAR